MMKRNRLIFYSIFGALHLFILLFSIYMDGKRDDFQFLIQMQSRIWMLKYCSLGIVVLFATSIILHVRDNRRHTKEIDKLNLDLNTLKAKLYDQQEGKKV
jgi:hypothetical protein